MPPPLRPATTTLNPAQLAAITHTGGPLILLAGPGTGKTHVITQRIAYQIKEHNRSPTEILAVTFTIKAAAELRERVAALVDSAQANQVQTATFNGFGARLMQRFAPYLNLPVNQIMIDQVQSRRLLKEIILAHDLFPDLRGVGLAALAAQLEATIESITNFGKTPDQCLAAAEQWRTRLAADGATLSAEDLAAEQVKLSQFVQESRVYKLYFEARLSRGWTNYSDQIMLPIRLLSECPGPRTTLQSEIKCVIVDEFQDCNPAQIELLRLLIGPHTHGGKPEICVVGDDDQAIYGFRGSDDRAFQRFASIWAPASPRVLALTENHRSQPQIIKAANQIITKANSRFQPDKTIVYPDGKLMTGGTIEAVKLSEELDDGDPIAAILLTTKAQHAKTSTEPFDWSNCAVIARGHGDLERAASALALYDIPFDKAKDRPLLEEDGVLDVLAWIEWLLNGSATWAARRLLMRAPYGIPAERIIAWEQAYRAQRTRFEEKFSNIADPGPYAAFLAFRAADEQPETATLLRLALTKYSELATSTTKMRGDDSVFEIISTTNASHGELLTSRERYRRVSALLALLTIAREKQMRLEQPRSLAQFWEYLAEADDHTALLPKIEVDALESDDAEPGDKTSGGGAGSRGRVQLLTAHSSKGLQFDLVIVPRVAPPHGYPKTAGSDSAWNFPPELFDTLDSRDPLTRKLDEERRLFYVACTRAKRRLVIIAKYKDKSKPSTAAANFFEELVPKTSAALVDVVYSADEIFAKAAELGVGPQDWATTRSTPTTTAASPAGATNPREALKEMVARVRRAARLRIATALEIAESPDMAAATLPGLEDSLLGALQLLAAAKAAERSGRVPDWIKSQPARREAERIVELKAGAAADPGATYPFKKLTGPFELSFTSINSFRRCPRCWYVQNVMKLPERESYEAGIGSLSHRVLEQFFKDWSSAEADNQPHPGLNELLTLARKQYERELDHDLSPDAITIDQLLSQMRMTYQKLHNESDHILEVEKGFKFDYFVGGASGQTIAQRMYAKLDRIDQLPPPGGGFRVIDYKTGASTKSRTQPKPDDLQLGIYYLALKSFYGLDSIPGRAEYWILSTGERGTLPFEHIREDKVRAVIDNTIEKMLAGDFERGKECSGECKILGL